MRAILRPLVVGLVAVAAVLGSALPVAAAPVAQTAAPAGGATVVASAARTLSVAQAPPPAPQPPRAGTPGPPTRSSAAERARLRAVEAAARARAESAKRAARFARAGQRAQALWEGRGRPRKMVVVRPATVDLVADGRLTRRLPKASGDLTLPALGRALPGSWLSITDGTARLSAAVVLTPGTTLDIGGPVTRLQLAGGDSLPDAASLYTGSGRLVLHGLAVTSADPAFGQPMQPAAGRAFVVVSPGGRLDATDVAFSDLGTTPTGVQDRPGVQFNPGSSGSLVRTTLQRNSTGLQLTAARDVRLEDVTVSDSTGDGLVLARDEGTTMANVHALRNGRDGVRIVEAHGLPVTSIVSAGNRRFGVAVNRSTGVRITGVRTAANGAGGLELSRATDVTATDLTATGEPIGVFIHIISRDIVLDRLTVTGGRRGVAIEKTTKHLTLRASTIRRAKVAGVAVGGSDITVQDVRVSDSRTGVRVERGAADVTAVGLRISGGQDGIVATAGTTGLTMRDLAASGIENDAVRSFSPGARILGGTLTGATTGINVAAPTTISDTAIRLVDNGIRTRSAGLVTAENVAVDALAVGIDTGPANPFLLTGSRVHALEAVRGELTERGTNDLSLPPLNLFGAIGIPLVLLALVLQAVHLARQPRRGTRRWTPRPVQTPTPPAATARRLRRRPSAAGRAATG
jgi:hypothetical protein